MHDCTCVSYCSIRDSICSQDSALVCLYVSLFNFYGLKDTQCIIQFIRDHPHTSILFIKFENPRIIGGSERIMGGS